MAHGARHTEKPQFLSYDSWLEQAPQRIKQDALWNFEVHRKALFLFAPAWLID